MWCVVMTDTVLHQAWIMAKFKELLDAKEFLTKKKTENTDPTIKWELY